MKKQLLTFANYIHKTLFVIVLFVIIANPVNASTLYSIASSSWSSGNTWSHSLGGPACDCTPTSSDVIIIVSPFTVTSASDITIGPGGNAGTLTIESGGSLNLSTKNFEVKSGGTFNLYGTISAKNVEFNNGSSVTTFLGSTITVTGDFENKNNSTGIIINGTMAVAGNFKNGDGATISGTTGAISVVGSVSNSGAVFGGSACSPSPCTFAGGSLPIELINFEAKLNEKIVELHWSTASEINNDFFTIEKSTNGSSFEFIAKKDGAGNSISRKDYSLSDDNPSVGTSYYRLKQTDFDGKFEYSNLVAVNYEKNSTGCVLTVYPNPCTSECTIDLTECDNSESPEINVELVDALGSKVFSKVPLRDDKGSFSFSFDSKNNLKPGIYIVRGVSKKENYTKKIIIK